MPMLRRRHYHYYAMRGTRQAVRLAAGAMLPLLLPYAYAMLLCRRCHAAVELASYATL